MMRATTENKSNLKQQKGQHIAAQALKLYPPILRTFKNSTKPTTDALAVDLTQASTPSRPWPPAQRTDRAGRQSINGSSGSWPVHCQAHRTAETFDLEFHQMAEMAMTKGLESTHTTTAL